MHRLAGGMLVEDLRLLERAGPGQGGGTEVGPWARLYTHGPNHGNWHGTNHASTSSRNVILFKTIHNLRVTDLLKLLYHPGTSVERRDTTVTG